MTDHEMVEPMIEFSKSKSKFSTLATTAGANGETQRLRFASKSRFYSMTDHVSPSSSRFYQFWLFTFALSIIEWTRWKINLICLFKPFSGLAYLPSCGPFQFLNDFLYRLTLTELALYACCFYYGLWCQGSGFLTGYFILGGGGTGRNATWWFTLTFILGVRNNFIFSILFGLSFERIIMFHRIIARLALFLGLLHFIYCIDQKDMASPSTWFVNDDDNTIFGTLTFICSILIFISSLEFVRRRFYEIFLKLHWILFILFGIFLWFHNGALIKWAALAVAIDVLFRVYSSFFECVDVKDVALLNGNVIRMEFDKKFFKYEAGQYVFICVPAISFTEFHPFSISSSPFNDESVVIHIRVLGDWTRKLQQLISTFEENNTDWNNLKCFIEGPYGQLQVAPLRNYSSIVMISGGIGITPLQSIFNELVHDIRLQKASTNKLKRLHFVWTIRDPEMLNEFEQRHWAGIKLQSANYVDGDKKKMRHDSIALPKYFSPNLFIVQKQKDFIAQTEVITHFYITGVSDKGQQQKYLDKFPFLKFGRPDIENIICEANNECDALMCVTKGCGVAVLCCGPDGMTSATKRFASKYGADFHHEIFAF